MECYIRSVDDNDPITLYQRPRGFGGVAVAFRKDFSQFCKEIKEGSPAIILPLVMDAAPSQLCIINAYLSCRGSHSEMEFDQALDILQLLLENTALLTK